MQPVPFLSTAPKRKSVHAIDSTGNDFLFCAIFVAMCTINFSRRAAHCAIDPRSSAGHADAKPALIWRSAALTSHFFDSDFEALHLIVWVALWSWIGFFLDILVVFL
jgi:hypothetical protein